MSGAVTRPIDSFVIRHIEATFAIPIGVFVVSVPTSIAIYVVVFQLPNVVARPVQLPAKNAALFLSEVSVFAEMPGQVPDLALLPLEHLDFLVGQRAGFNALFDAFMLTIKTVQ